MRCKRALSFLYRHAPRMIVVISLWLAGCASSPVSLLWPQTSFPPQRVIQNGDYRSFLADNQRTLTQCRGRTECDITLFNLGFVYAYPSSPYRDPQKARQFLNELYSRYPQSPWTSQGQVLLAFMNDQVSAEETQRRLRAELRTRDAAIRKLREQLNRLQEIDIEIEKKERELLR
jgi:hypothetical protein